MFSDDSCPWCHAEQDDLFEWFIPDEPDAVYCDCEYCGKPLMIECEIVYTITRREEDK